MIRSAANDELPEGWLFLPRGEITAQTECVLLVDDVEDLENIAATLGFPEEGLSTDDLKSIFRGAQSLVANPSDSVLVRAYTYYLEFDAYLPSIDAPDPPPPEVTQAKLDRQFYQSLGTEPKGTSAERRGADEAPSRLAYSADRTILRVLRSDRVRFRIEMRGVCFGSMLLQKYFRGGELKFSEPLMRLAPHHVRDHILSRRNDHGSSYRRHGA